MKQLQKSECLLIDPCEEGSVKTAKLCLKKQFTQNKIQLPCCCCFKPEFTVFFSMEHKNRNFKECSFHQMSEWGLKMSSL